MDDGRRGARADRRAASRPRAQARADQAGRGRGPARVRLHRGDVRRGRAAAVALRRFGAHRPRAGADRALLDEPRPADQWARRAHRRGHPGPALRVGCAGRRVSARGLPSTLPRVRAGAVTDRRRRGAALPPVRARAADPRGRPGAADGGGDGDPRPRPAAARLADDGLRPPALPAALRRAGRRRAHGVRARGRRRGPRAHPRGDRVRGPRGIHPLHRGGGGGGGAVVGGALRRGRDEHASRGRARCEDDRGRGNGGRPGHRRAGGLGGGVHVAVRGAAGAAHRRALRHDALPRRRLLRPRREPHLARGGPSSRGRGTGERLGRERGGQLVASEVRADRTGEAEGLREAEAAVSRDPAGGMSQPALDAARESGLVRPGEPLLVMVSGGGDSVALLDIADRLGASPAALHVNYQLRDDASLDQALVQQLCTERNIPLTVKHVELGTQGNLQERARDARYSLAERLAEGDYAAAHTASDQAETVLYRLAVSPGSRALQGMAPRRGRLVRPLLGVTREEVRSYLRSRDLEWREDPSNADRRFARARVRHDLLDALRSVGPAAERTIAETARQLREEADVLDAAVDAALEELGGGPAVSASVLGRQLPAVRRLVLRRLAEQAGGQLRAGDADRILALGGRGSKWLDLGGGLRAVVEYGTLRFSRAPEERVPEPVALPVPGRARFGEWEVEAEVGVPGEVAVRGAVGPLLTVRAWQDGDRMRPVGLGGTKSLQDLFTDRKVPRALRRSLPVVVSEDQIVWVAGVAVDERFAAAEGEPG